MKGMVRDEFGWVLRNDGAEIVVRQGETIIGRAPIINELNFESNYRVNLPVDSNLTSDRYRSGALLAESQYTIEIHSGGAVYLPIETLTGGLPSPEPGAVVTLNLTLGEDSDFDGLPDDWEYWQLQAAGLFPGDLNYHLGQLGDGDWDSDGISDQAEYQAGTFATEASSALTFDTIGLFGSDLVQFNYNAVVDKAYQVEASTDGVTWTTVPVSLGTAIEPSQEAWTAERNGPSTLFAPVSGKKRLYRLRAR